MVDWSELPKEVLVLVLQQLEQHERLESCALVSRSWRDAAVAATTRISYIVNSSLRSSVDCSQMLAWLGQHGQHVSSLHLSAIPARTSLPCLPCSQLRELHLDALSLQLGPTSGQQGLLHACMGLTELACEGCVFEGPDSLPALTALTDLRRLSLINLGGPNVSTSVTLPPSLLSHLVRLTSLHLATKLSEGSFQHLSRLSELKNLLLHAVCCDLTAASFSGLSHLTALQELELAYCDNFDPVLLGSLKQLQTLVLERTHLWGGAAGTAALLAALPQLQQLTRLEMYKTLRHCTAPAAYSGLTAASQLHCLNMWGCKLPAMAWQHMCAGGRHLPYVAELQLSDVQLEAAGSTHLMGAGQLSYLVKCFPSVKELHLQESLQSDVQLTGLQHLTGLTSLGLERVAKGVVASLANLTRLVNLRIEAYATVTMVDVLQLTALKRLTSFHIDCPAWEKHSPTTCYLFNKAPYGRPPDVWSRILEVCSGAGECQPLLLCQQRQQLQQLQAELEQARAETAQACAAAARAQTEAKQARFEAAQARKAAARAEAGSAHFLDRIHYLEQAMASALGKLNDVSTPAP